MYDFKHITLGYAPTRRFDFPDPKLAYQNMDVFPVINKIDLPSADPDRVAAEIEDVIGLEAHDAPRISVR